MNAKKNKQFPIGFTAMDNRLFYCQSVVSPNAFSVLIRIHRMTEGYDGEPKSLSNTYFQKTCNISKNTVTRAIKELEQNNLIIVKRRARANSLYLVNTKTMFDIYESQVSTSCIPKEVTDESPDMCSIKQNLIKQNTIKENINIPFSDFWTKYDYCKGKKSDVEAKWITLTDVERTLTMESLDKYLLSTPDKTYRKYPMSYLNTEAWNDEVVLIDSKPTDNQNNAKTSSYNSNNAGNNNTYSASHKEFKPVFSAKVTRQESTDNTDSTNHIKDDLECNLEALGYCSGMSTDTINTVDTMNTKHITSNQIHWSELKAKGLLKTKVNPHAVVPNTDIDKKINDFLNTFGSKRAS